MAKKIAPAPVASGAGAGEGRCENAPNHSKNCADTLADFSDADRAWFERHPRSRWRITPTEPGEWPDEVRGCPWTAVRTVGVGRVRIPLTGALPPGLTDRGIDRLVQEIAPDGARLIAAMEQIAREVRP